MGRSCRSTHPSSSENTNTPRSDWEQTRKQQRSGIGCDTKQTVPQRVGTRQAVHTTYPRRMSQEKSLRRLCKLVPRRGIRHDGGSGQEQQLAARCPLTDERERREVGRQQSEATYTARGTASAAGGRPCRQHLGAAVTRTCRPHRAAIKSAPPTRNACYELALRNSLSNCATCTPRAYRRLGKDIHL